MEQYFESDFVKILFSKENNLIKLIWKRKVLAEEYRTGFTKAFELIKKYKILRFISDIRNQGAVQIEEVKWLQDILQKAIIAGLEKIAVIINENSYSRIYLDTIKNKIRGTMVEMEYFNSENSAMEWINTLLEE